MYIFSVKENGPDIEIIATRAMLALAGLSALVYRQQDGYVINIAVAAILFITAFLIKFLIEKYRINKLILLLGATLLVLVATHSIILAIILLLYGYLVKYLKINPIVELTGDGVSIKKLFSEPVYEWNEFTNIILKDGLLSLDFKTNKLIQVDIDENKGTVDETAFNEFCKANIIAAPVAESIGK